MGPMKRQKYAITIVEQRTYTVVATGTSAFEAEQEAIAKFKANRSDNAVLNAVGRPIAVRARPIE